MAGLLTLTGDFSGDAVCDDTRPTTVTVATAPPTTTAAIVLKMVPTRFPPRSPRSPYTSATTGANTRRGSK